MVPADAGQPLCSACELTPTIPNLNAPNSRYLWYRLEPAKRRFQYTLAALDLPFASRAGPRARPVVRVSCRGRPRAADDRLRARLVFRSVVKLTNLCSQRRRPRRREDDVDVMRVLASVSGSPSEHWRLKLGAQPLDRGLDHVGAAFRN
jgi:hypothetical protein